MKRVLLLLAQGVEWLEAAAFADVLGWADALGDVSIDVVCAGLHPRLRCTFGCDVVPDVLVDQIDVADFDALAIPGGFEPAGFYEDAYAPAFLDVIRAFDRAHKPIAAICVGALPVAKSGVLDGRQATTYKLLDGKRRKQLAQLGARVVDAPVVQDGNVITSTGPGTATDVAFRLLEALTSIETVNQIRHLMGFE